MYHCTYVRFQGLKILILQYISETANGINKLEALNFIC